LVRLLLLPHALFFCSGVPRAPHSFPTRRSSDLVHAPPVLVLDEPFEAVDPVSGMTIRRILRTFVDNGGTVVLSSHVMELVEGLCDHVAVMADGQVRAAGTLDAVRAGRSLQDRFVELVGGARDEVEGLEWLHT